MKKMKEYVKVARYTIVKAWLMVFSLLLPILANADGSGVSVSAKLDPPLGGVNSLNEFIAKILNVVVDIGTPVAVLFIVFAGFLFVTAQGDVTKVTKAKSAFTWAIVGTAVLLGAWVLAVAIEGTIGNLK